MSKTEFNPKMKESEWGLLWQQRKKGMLAATGRKYLLLCVGRVSPEKGVDELINTMPLLDDCLLWLVGDGPTRAGLEELAKTLNIPAKFWGYQRGEALHAVYTVADCFVCPSLTETFGQTVNEAIASRLPIAIPDVPVFREAYSEWLPTDAMWEPLDRQGMARAIQNQLRRGDKALPSPTKLKSWPDACNILLQDYCKASTGRKAMTFSSLLFLPFWCSLCLVSAFVIYTFSAIRTLAVGLVLDCFRKTILEASKSARLKKHRSFLFCPLSGLTIYLKAVITSRAYLYTKSQIFYNSLFISSLTLICIVRVTAMES